MPSALNHLTLQSSCTLDFQGFEKRLLLPLRYTCRYNLDLPEKQVLVDLAVPNAFSIQK